MNIKEISACWTQSQQYSSENTDLSGLDVCDDDSVTLIMEFNDKNIKNKIEASNSDGRISLAYENFKEIPKSIIDRFATMTTMLDLSHNKIKDLSFLSNCRMLNTLILDKNPSPDELTLPFLPSLELIWLNHCEIENVSKWVFRLQTCCPGLKFLSMMGNPGVTSLFNGNSMTEHNDYRMFVINTLPKLQHLDDMAVRATHREHAKKQRISNFGDGSFNIFDKINILNKINYNPKEPNSIKSSKATAAPKRNKNVAGTSGTKKKSNKKKSDEQFECISSTD